MQVHSTNAVLTELKMCGVGTVHCWGADGAYGVFRCIHCWRPTLHTLNSISTNSILDYTVYLKLSLRASVECAQSRTKRSGPSLKLCAPNNGMHLHHTP